MADFLDVVVEGGGFCAQSFPFAGRDICAERFAFDSRALAFEMRQQFLMVFIKLADGLLDRTPRRDTVVSPLAFPPPHHAIMPQPLALVGLHPRRAAKKYFAVIPLVPTQEGSHHAAGSAFSFGFCKLRRVPGCFVPFPETYARFSVRSMPTFSARFGRRGNSGEHMHRVNERYGLIAPTDATMKLILPLDRNCSIGDSHA